MNGIDPGKDGGIRMIPICPPGAAPYPARIVPRERLLETLGFGWEEDWIIGDDEEPEGLSLEPCVWINGHVMLESGSNADAGSDLWRENYGRKYGMRIWTGAKPPTEEQRRGAPWGGMASEGTEKPFGNADGAYSGLISEE